MTPDNPHSFHRVLEKELEDIKQRRTGTSSSPAHPGMAGGEAEDFLSEEKKERERQREALDQELTGLALSGGGIRSATFALGILQGLALCGLLRRFDYLSTVSGGGYIGSWLAAWIKREGQVESVERQLKPGRIDQAQGRKAKLQLSFNEEPEPVHHLRDYTSYLAPRRGLLSADNAVLLAIYLRNIFLNHLVLLPLCVVVLLVPRLLVYFYDWDPDNLSWSWILAVLMLLALVVALYNIFVNRVSARTLRQQGTENRPEASANGFDLQLGLNRFQLSVLAPLYLRFCKPHTL
jgi:hypothetical protein